MFLKLGQTIEVHNFRVHRYANSINATDLTNANKRGKKCNEYVVYEHYLSDKEAQVYFDLMANLIKDCQSMESVETLMTTFAENKKLSFQHRELRGVDVAPSSKDFQEVKFETTGVSVKLEWDSFSIRDKVDQNNLPVIMDKVSGANARKFHKVWTKNPEKFEAMTFAQLHTWFCDQDYESKAFIKFHYYCSMD